MPPTVTCINLDSSLNIIIHHMRCCRLHNHLFLHLPICLCLRKTLSLVIQSVWRNIHLSLGHFLLGYLRIENNGLTEPRHLAPTVWHIVGGTMSHSTLLMNRKLYETYSCAKLRANSVCRDHWNLLKAIIKTA